MSAHRSSVGHAWWRLATLVAVVLVALPLSAVQSPNAIALDEEPPLVSLYVLDYLPQPALQPLDPATLFELPDRIPLDSGEDFEIWDADISADGTTVVTIGQEKNTFGPRFAIVRDGETFQERLRFQIPGTAWMSTLSDDGSRFVVRAEVGEAFEPTMTPTWQVFDTWTGDNLITIAADPSINFEQASAIDGDAHRLYRLTIPPSPDNSWENTAPETARLVVNDLTTGTELGRIDLPDVRAGYWTSAETAVVQGTEMHLPSHLSPAISLSADGGRLAIVHADEDVVTMIDTERLEIDRTTAFAPRGGWLDGLLGLVPLWPQGASAKFMEGAFVDAVFTSDGRYLYVTGTTGSIEDGEPVQRSLGLRAIDVETGVVVSSLSDQESWFGRVVPAPDSSDLYVSTYGNVGGIRRLDPHTLEVRAERATSDMPHILIAPKTTGIDM